jgi:hypothetical protein
MFLSQEWRRIARRGGRERAKTKVSAWGSAQPIEKAKNGEIGCLDFPSLGFENASLELCKRFLALGKHFN